MVTSENAPPSRVSSEGGAREGAGKWWGVETPSDSRFERGRVWWWSGSEQGVMNTKKEPKKDVRLYKMNMKKGTDK